MKKSLGLVLIIVLLGMSTFAQQQGEMTLSLNTGVVADDSFSFSPFYWTGGLQLDMYFSDSLMVSPECYAIFEEFSFEYVNLVPGILINFKAKNLILGGGIIRYILIGDSITYEGKFALKLNLGFQGNAMKLMAFIHTPFDDLFVIDYMLFGVTLGFEF